MECSRAWSRIWVWIPRVYGHSIVGRVLSFVLYCIFLIACIVLFFCGAISRWSARDFMVHHHVVPSLPKWQIRLPMLKSPHGCSCNSLPVTSTRHIHSIPYYLSILLFSSQFLLALHITDILPRTSSYIVSTHLLFTATLSLSLSLHQNLTQAQHLPIHYSPWRSSLPSPSWEPWLPQSSLLTLMLPGKFLPRSSVESISFRLR